MSEELGGYLQLIGSFVVAVIWHALPLLLPILIIRKHILLTAIDALFVFIQIGYMTGELYIHN